MVDIGELKKSEFWNKKIRRAVETHDADKNGSITRSDFEFVVERYKMSAGGSYNRQNRKIVWSNVFFLW